MLFSSLLTKERRTGAEAQSWTDVPEIQKMENTEMEVAIEPLLCLSTTNNNLQG